jgi:hypothetical protein
MCLSRVEDIGNIQEIMVRKLVTIGAEADLATAARRMTKKESGASLFCKQVD